MTSLQSVDGDDLVPTTANVVQMPGPAFNRLIAELRAARKVVEAAQEIHPAYQWLCQAADQAEPIHVSVQQRFADFFAALAELEALK